MIFSRDKGLIVLNCFIVLINLSSGSSNHQSSWRKLEDYTQHWITRWAEDAQAEYGSVLNDLKLSNQCRQSLDGYIKGLKNFELDSVKMFDSTGRLPSGLLQGTWSDLGAFDECLTLQSSQYCLVYGKMPLSQHQRNMEGFFKPHSRDAFNFSNHQLYELSEYAHFFAHMNLTIGICLPMGCSTSEIRSIVRSALEPHDTGMIFDLDLCQNRSESIPWLTREIVSLLIIATVIGLNLLGTLFSKNQFLGYFNVYTNFEKSIKVPRNKYPVLNGIKAITLLYLICGHILWGLTYSSFDRLFNMEDSFVHPIGWAIIIAPIALETFFLVTGLEMMTFFIDSKSQFQLAPFLIVRWFRFAVTIGWMICLYIVTFSDHVRILLGGPLWHHLNAASSVAETCGRKWPQHLALIAHYFDSTLDLNTCLLPDYYLEVDFVCTILFLSVLFPFLAKRKSLAIFNALFLSIIGSLTTALIIWAFSVQSSWLPGNFLSIEFYKYLIYIHSKPWAHLAPYFIGVLLAFALKPDKPRLSKSLINVAWLTCLVMLTWICFYEISVNINLFSFSSEVSFFYGISFRIFWSLSIGWIIYASKYSLIWFWINKFLSWPVFGIISRFNLNALFLNFFFIRLNNATIRSKIDLSFYSVCSFIGLSVLVQTYVTSFVFTCIIDKPITNILVSLLRKADQSNNLKPPTSIKPSDESNCNQNQV